MKVMKARYAGACYGVQRALDMAEKIIAAGETAYTLGPLIHNPTVVAHLARCGVVAISEVNDIKDSTVIIRSHGVTPAILHKLKTQDLKVVDATCPHVARAQKAAAQLAEKGCRVLVVGEAGHPEVEGLTACVQEAGGKVDVVASTDDIPSNLYNPVGVVVQTTQRRETLDEVVNALTAAGLVPIVKNTICSATSQRQRTAAELAAQVDAMVIIGGRNSSNTTRLAEICSAHCAKSFHIETADELHSNDFLGCSVVGVTAGASTPENQIDGVVRTLEAL